MVPNDPKLNMAILIPAVSGISVQQNILLSVISYITYCLYRTALVSNVSNLYKVSVSHTLVCTNSFSFPLFSAQLCKIGLVCFSWFLCLFCFYYPVFHSPFSLASCSCEERSKRSIFSMQVQRAANTNTQPQINLELLLFRLPTKLTRSPLPWSRPLFACEMFESLSYRNTTPWVM